MAHQVVSRFFHRASGRYIDPGQDCPPLPVEDVKRLVRARCLVEVQDSPPSEIAPQGARKGRPARQDAKSPPEE